MNQTVKQIHTAFDAVLDILSLQEERAASLGLPAQDADNFKTFLERTAVDLMSLSALSLLRPAQNDRSFFISQLPHSVAQPRP